MRTKYIYTADIKVSSGWSFNWLIVMQKQTAKQYYLRNAVTKTGITPVIPYYLMVTML
ncbi:hypothetical protein J0796_06505 [Bacillus paranthracis]|uniref:hypothetical protein n=1 Tax=Bacillus TaxID=1386 RepID=UPI000A7CAEFB|nr:hypothetical protein [Bacillus sp. UMTAT18]